MKFLEKMFRKPVAAPQEAVQGKSKLSPEDLAELNAIREEVRKGMREIPEDASASKILEMYREAVTFDRENSQHMTHEEEKALDRLADKE